MERRYPDPAVRVLDPRFNALRLGMASVECLYQGARWSEGPCHKMSFGSAHFFPCRYDPILENPE